MVRKEDRGYTMIIVMCLMFLFMALALSMLFSSAQTLARAEREAARKQCRASAVSFAEWIDEELRIAPASGGMSKYIKNRLLGEEGKDRWPAYTGGLEGEATVAVLKFKPKELGTSTINELGDLEVKMYWETEEGGGNAEDPDVNLVVTVKAVVQKEQFSVTTRYAKTLINDVWDGTWNVRGRE